MMVHGGADDDAQARAAAADDDDDAQAHSALMKNRSTPGFL